MENAMKNLMVEYTYAVSFDDGPCGGSEQGRQVLAVLETLSTEAEMFEYLQFQRTYFDGMALIEFSVPHDGRLRNLYN
jgi:hypothetical protein